MIYDRTFWSNLIHVTYPTWWDNKTWLLSYYTDIRYQIYDPLQ